LTIAIIALAITAGPEGVPATMTITLVIPVASGVLWLVEREKVARRYKEDYKS